MSLSFYSESHVTARKDHVCHICRLTIKRGEKYSRESGKWEDEFFDRCTCPVCEKVRDDYLRCGNDEYDDESISEHANEAFCYGKDCHEDCEYANCLHCPKVREVYGKEGDL